MKKCLLCSGIQGLRTYKTSITLNNLLKKQFYFHFGKHSHILLMSHCCLCNGLCLADKANQTPGSHKTPSLRPRALLSPFQSPDIVVKQMRLYPKEEATVLGLSPSWSRYSSVQ